jgi:hypothetical protein
MSGSDVVFDFRLKAEATRFFIGRLVASGFSRKASRAN